jgi:hypothetical protein
VRHDGPLTKHLLNHIAAEIRELLVAAVVQIEELVLVEPERMQDGQIS